MMNDKLRAAAQAVLKSTKSLSVCCENFNHRKQDFHDDGKCPPWRRYNDALTALEAALAEQTVQKSLTVAEQEPVAWTTMPEAEDWCFVSSSKDPTGKLEGKWFPLYTAPPRREWVGLTHEEIQAIHDTYYRRMGRMEFARTIEAKLKEKNGG